MEGSGKVFDVFKSAHSTIKAKGAVMNAKIKDITARSDFNVQHLARKGRVAILEKMGKLDSTHDVVLDRRTAAVEATQDILKRMDKEFQQLVKHLGFVADHYEALSGLLEEFRGSCDAELGMEDEEMLGERSALPGHADPLPAAPSPRQPEDKTLENFCRQVREQSNELQETIRNSCMNISRNTMGTLDAESARISQTVDRVRVDFDLKRDEVRRLQEQIQSLSADLEANRDKAGTSPEVAVAMAETLAETRKTHGVKQELMVAQRGNFEETCGKAKGELRFLLEQTSMSTWSCYNILFTQVGNFFEGVAGAGRDVTKALITLKNSQTVAKSLTEERRGILHEQRRTAEAEARDSSLLADWSMPKDGGAMASPQPPAAAASPPSNVPPPIKQGEDEIDFESFAAQRTAASEKPAEAGSSPTPPPAKTSFDDMFS